MENLPMKRINGRDYNMNMLLSVEEKVISYMRGDFSGSASETITVYTFIDGTKEEVKVK